MNYALIENGTVANIIWLYPGNVHEFPNAVALENRPVTVGDVYVEGSFTRNGEPVLNAEEAAQAVIAELDAAVIDLEYRNILLEMGVNEDAV